MPKGTLTVGMPCSRTAFGDDDCAPGLACTLRGVATGSLICRKFCHADTDCAQGETCSGRVTQAFPMDGMCIPTCNPFSNDCGSGLTCAVLSIGVGSTTMMPNLKLLCRSSGIGQPGDVCTADTDCGDSQLCLGQTTGACTALCDDAHACAGGDPDAGLSCTTLPGVGAGTCG